MMRTDSVTSCARLLASDKPTIRLLVKLEDRKPRKTKSSILGGKVATWSRQAQGVWVSPSMQTCDRL
jgi:hypothetical protein